MSRSARRQELRSIRQESRKQEVLELEKKHPVATRLYITFGGKFEDFLAMESAGGEVSKRQKRSRFRLARMKVQRDEAAEQLKKSRAAAEETMMNRIKKQAKRVMARTEGFVRRSVQ